MANTGNELVNDEVPLTKLDDNLDHPTVSSEEMTDEEWRLYREDYNLLSCHDSFS